MLFNLWIKIKKLWYNLTISAYFGLYIKAEPISNSRNRSKSGANRSTQSRASKTEDKTFSSKRTFGRKRDEEKSSSSEKPRGNSNRFSSKKSETSSSSTRNRRVSSSLKSK